jgi:hypothetical protein
MKYEEENSIFTFSINIQIIVQLAWQIIDIVFK